MKRILVVDDDQLVLKSICQALQGDYLVKGFNSPLMALDDLKTSEYDLLLVDYKMYPMDGAAMLKELRLWGNMTTVVMITAFRSPDLDKTCKELDVFKVLDKPLDLDILISTIGMAIRRNSQSVPHLVAQPLFDYDATENDLMKYSKDDIEKWVELYDLVDSIIVVLSEDGRIIFINQAFTHLTGYPLEELRGVVFWDYFMNGVRGSNGSDGTDPSHYPMMSRVRQYLTVKNGTIGHIELSYSKLHDENGRTRFVIVTGKDLSMTESMEEGFFRSTEEGNFVIVNQMLASMLGYESPEALMAVNLSDVFAIPYERPQLTHWNVNLSGIVYNNVQWRRKDGTLLDVRLKTRVRIDSNGGFESFEVFVADLSETKQMENQLMHLQRLESLGVMASGMAHDFNNILTVIQGRISFLDPKGTSEHVKAIQDVCHRAGHLTRQILAYGRTNYSQLQCMPVNGITESACSMMETTLDKNIKFKLNLDTDLVSSFIEPTQIEQVILNHLVNSRDAMPDGGTIEVSTENVTITPGPAEEYLEAQEGTYAHISIRDSGTGMPEDVKKRVFEPFYTTKGIGKGTGLGMPIAYRIIKEHKGFIRIDSAVGKGTTVNIYLPAVSK